MFQLCLGCMKPIGDAQVCPHCGYAKGTPAKEPYHITPGVMLRKYLIGRVLGYGGFGVTYLAYDTQLETKVAIKEYLPGEFATRMPGETQVTVYSGEKTVMFNAGKDKFMDEARRLAQFASVPGIVTILDVFDANGTSYIVMEYLEGETVRDRLAREKKIPEEEAVAIMLPVLDALTSVHEKGIIHRDVSPDNIFLTEDGQVKLLDFGAARYASTGHSKSLSVILKPGFAPEEQYRSRGKQGPWSDVYACAATLYKMLSGITPEDAMERCSNDEVKPLSKLHVSIRHEREIAIMNAMNVYQEHRTQSAAQFKEELIAGLPVKRIKDLKNKQPVFVWTKTQKIILAVVLSLTAAVIGFGAYGMMKGGTPFYVLQGDEKAVKVPDVVGESDTTAEQKTIDAGLVPLISRGDYSDVIEAGMIVNQLIEAGKSVDKGATLEMIMSLGSEQIELPDVSGLEKAEAEALLRDAGFTVKISEETSNIAPGLVIRQSPEPGFCAKGSEVEIVVSTGKDVDKNLTETIGDYVGKKYDDIEKMLDGKDIYIKKFMQESDKPEGEILAQDIAPGTTVHHGDTITLTVSSGKKKYAVKDYTTWTYSNAYADLTGMGFAVNYQYEENSLYARDLVLRQSVAAGTETDNPGSITVTLTISTGGTKADQDEAPQTAPATTKATTTTKTTTQTTRQTTTATETEATVAPQVSEQPAEPTGIAGTIGDLRYSLDYTRNQLYISGNGSMYTMQKTDYPWYSDRDKVTTLEIGEGVEYLGENAFEDFTNLEQVTLPSTLRELPEYAFYNCTRLTEIMIPDGVTVIGVGAFSGCSALRTVGIGSNVRVIERYAFMNCTALNVITLPVSLNEVQQGAFFNFIADSDKENYAYVWYTGVADQWEKITFEPYNDLLLNSNITCGDRMIVPPGNAFPN